jgi:death-on-curing protein
MSGIVFLDLEQVLRLYTKIMTRFGGLAGIRDRALLESAVVYPQTLYFYDNERDVLVLAAAYCFRIIKYHPFLDGNKRTAVLVMIAFLEKNNLFIEIDTDTFYTLLLQVAAGKKEQKDVVNFLMRSQRN